MWRVVVAMESQMLSEAQTTRVLSQALRLGFPAVNPGVFIDAVATSAANAASSRAAIAAVADSDAGYGKNLSPGIIGAISELLVCADLLARRFHVFRAVSPACPCDLIAMVGGRTYRVEVKTVRKESGRKANAYLKTQEKLRHDILALVLQDGSIEYRPAIVDLLGFAGEAVEKENGTDR